MKTYQNLSSYSIHVETNTDYDLKNTEYENIEYENDAFGTNERY